MMAMLRNRECTKENGEADLDWRVGETWGVVRDPIFLLPNRFPVPNRLA